MPSYFQLIKWRKKQCHELKCSRFPTYSGWLMLQFTHLLKILSFFKLFWFLWCSHDILCDFFMSLFYLVQIYFLFRLPFLKLYFFTFYSKLLHHIANHGLLFKECPTHLGENIPIPRLWIIQEVQLCEQSVEQTAYVKVYAKEGKISVPRGYREGPEKTMDGSWT